MFSYTFYLQNLFCVSLPLYGLVFCVAYVKLRRCFFLIFVIAYLRRLNFHFDHIYKYSFFSFVKFYNYKDATINRKLIYLILDNNDYDHIRLFFKEMLLRAFLYFMIPIYLNDE